MSSIVVPDACVLIPAALRDIIFRAYLANMYQMRLTDSIVEEVRRNLVRKMAVREDKAQRLVEVIRIEFSECFVFPKEHLISSMPINEKDKHVLAAAVRGRADLIVTLNLKDFPIEPLADYQVAAISPDAFLINLFYTDKEQIARVLVKQARSLKKPPMTILELLDNLQPQTPVFANLLKEEFTQRDKKPWIRSLGNISDIL